MTRAQVRAHAHNRAYLRAQARKRKQAQLRARENPSRNTWIAIGVGGALVVGVGAYFIFRKQPTPPALNTPGAPNLPPPPPPVSAATQLPPAQPPPVASQLQAPQLRYSIPFQDGGGFTLNVGDSVLITPPGVATASGIVSLPGGRRFEFQSNGGLETIWWNDTQPGGNTATDLGTFKAVTPGTWRVKMDTYVPQQGGNDSPQFMNVSINPAQLPSTSTAPIVLTG